MAKKIEPADTREIVSQVSDFLANLSHRIDAGEITLTEFYTHSEPEVSLSFDNEKRQVITTETGRIKHNVTIYWKEEPNAKIRKSSGKKLRKGSRAGGRAVR